MNKSVMALAVAGALAVPAAALAQVEIGGSITVFYYRHDPDNPSSGQKGDILESSEPEMYIRGAEKLGGGVSAWFQCTSSLDGMISGSSEARGLCGRNSGIGFRGGFGNAFVGNWDMPEKLVDNRARGWWGGTNSLTGGSMVLLKGGSASGARTPVQTTAGTLTVTGGVIGTGTTTAITNNPEAFYRRQAGTLNYHSPSWGGFSFQAAYSADIESTGRPESSLLDPRLWSLAGHYATGPFYVGLGYENHADFNPANRVAGSAAAQYSGGDDTTITAVLGYRMGGFDVRVLYSKSEYDVTNSTTLDVDGWALFADWNIQGPHTLRVMYADVGDTEGNASVSVGSYKGPVGTGCGPASNVSCASNTGASLIGVAYSYAVSKRTEVSLAYSKMDNDSSATFSKGKTSATAGSGQTAAGLVLKHRF